ncbi:hypothetical protein HX049_00705 [Myroides odoratimimus]|uniref:hypothetical protein n=1 Tax=Myroides odoratimimus TaxID=76832 RepID=UPI002577A433|nr:hypothetical protein [Myroides odoratimimus]MDM1395705.1 hypothetical protein [Myroides odoratimimus]
MKQYLFILLITLSSHTAISQDKYPDLLERDDIEMSIDDYKKYSKKEYYREYIYIYKHTISKNSKADIGAPNEVDLPWNLIKNFNPQIFFETAVKTISLTSLENDKYTFNITVPLTQSEKEEQRRTGGIKTKTTLADLLYIKILSSNLTNTTTKQTIVLDDHLIRSTGNWFPQTNPTHQKYLYFNYLNNIKDIKGNVKVQLIMPTNYEITEITKDQIAKEIQVNKDLRIKLLAFEDNIIHFEVLDNKELNLDITYNNDYGGGSSNTVIDKQLYDFYRLNTGLPYPDFEKKATEYYNDLEDKEVDENKVYMYRLTNKVEKFYLYQIDEATQLMNEKELTLNYKTNIQ